jgi:hypothetical protein
VPITSLLGVGETASTTIPAGHSQSGALSQTQTIIEGTTLPTPTPSPSVPETPPVGGTPTPPLTPPAGYGNVPITSLLGAGVTDVLPGPSGYPVPTPTVLPDLGAYQTARPPLATQPIQSSGKSHFPALYMVLALL